MKRRIDQRGCMEALRADASHYIKVAAESRKSGCPHNVAANALLISEKIHTRVWTLVRSSVQTPPVRNGAEATCDSTKLSGNVVGAFLPPGFLINLEGKSPQIDGSNINFWLEMGNTKVKLMFRQMKHLEPRC